MRGYVVVFEGDDESGYPAYSPDLPRVVAAGDSRQETETLMVEAMAAHMALLRQEGEPVPEQSESASVMILDPAAAQPVARRPGGLVGSRLMTAVPLAASCR